MGVRLYTPTLGRFLQTDPVPGGSASTYAYPTDPINQFDLNGQWWGWRKTLRRAATITGYVAAGACIVASAGACAVVTAAAIGASAAWNAYQWRNGDDSGRRVSGWRAARSFGIDAITARFRPVRHSRAAPRHRVARTGWRAFGRHTVHQRKYSYSRSRRWHAGSRRGHVAVWSGVNTYYGYRSYRNGW
jgi:hypothetical protein